MLPFCIQECIQGTRNGPCADGRSKGASFFSCAACTRRKGIAEAHGPTNWPDACLRMAGLTAACCCRGPWGCQAS